MRNHLSRLAGCLLLIACGAGGAESDSDAEMEAPARSSYGMSSWVHDGHQYLMLQTSSKLTAVALPAAAPTAGGH